MESSVTYIDILTVVAAVIAAVAAIYTAIDTRRTNEKKDLLDNYTSERLRDLREMKKCANILLNEATMAIYFTKDRQDVEARISKIVEASNEYWFILKPVYVRDEEVIHAMLDLKNEIIDYYKETKESEREKHIPLLKEKGMCFRKLAFIYAHSSWTCIKNQITYGEYSQYYEFNKVYTDNEKLVEELINNTENQENREIWYL